MSDKHPNNVFPAFPVPREISWATNPDGSNTPLVGLTIRDYFAAAALPTFLANDETQWDEDVRDAYAVADKMIKQREL